MAAIKVLMVGDGPFMDQNPPALGIRFLKDASGNYVQDTTDGTFTVSELIYLLTTSTPSISVDTAHRRDDPNATFPNFNFATATDLSNYDVLWIIGYEGYNYRYYGTAVSEAELEAIAEFMDGGGGVFATGDHEGMGSYICGQIPRVRTMRMWYGQAGDIPAGVPATAVNSQGQTVSSVNWPGVSTATAGRADTLRQNPSDTAAVFQFDDQSDAIPQPLAFPGGTVHAILEGEQGPISRFPDHMHEGEVVTPSDAGQVVAINGQHFTEYPAVNGFQPLPGIIATGAIVGGHETLVEGSACEQANFGSDTMPTVARPLGVLGAYDGHGVGVGRVVTDSSFHHLLDLNLIGDPCGSAPDRQQGFGPGRTPPAAGSVLADLQAFYVNTVVWLARVDQSFYFTVDKSSFGIDEATNAFPQFSETFWLVVNGFSLNQVQASLAAGNPDLSGPFAEIGGIVISRGTPVGEAGVAHDHPQRVAIPYSVQFSAASVPSFPQPNHSPVEMLLAATFTIGAKTFAAETVFTLDPGENPYFQNVNPNFGNAFYLSRDLAVFTVTPHQDPAPVLGVTFDPSLPDAPYQYIQDLLGALNSDSQLTNPSSPDKFPSTFPSQFITDGDSSVTPGTSAHPSYNFCVARVRLNGAVNATAPGVKVFFRLFITQTSDTDYEPNGSYFSTLDGQGLPALPLPAPDGETTPFFATAVGASGDYGTNGPNIRPITVTDAATGEAWAYFGCYLNVYDPSINLKLYGTHHCVVAQIAFDDAPVVNSNGVTASPENSDKLAQRNMQVTFSGNPSSEASRVIPQTFDLRPSPVPAAAPGQLLNYPDELMISWGNTPAGSTASIFWPQVQASDVLDAASQLYSVPQLTGSGHTLQCQVGAGVTYVPIPSGVAQNVAGLLTVTLPPGVTRGQEFDIVVRRIASRQIIILAAEGTPGPAGVAVAAATNGGRSRPVVQDNWRYVVGTFQVKIPVAAESALLPAEEDTYAILLWRLQSLSSASRWHPVLEQYVSLLAARVDAFGGNASGIEPSPWGAPVGGHRPEPWPRIPGTKEFTGKVTGLVYDRFGDFEGFLLVTELGDEHAFRATEAASESVLRFAWADRVLLSVVVREHRRDRPVSIILRRAER
jgi:hypothetical protein